MPHLARRYFAWRGSAFVDATSVTPLRRAK